MKEKWKEYFKGRYAGVKFGVTLAATVLCLFTLSKFIVFIEARKGVVLDDPLFHLYDAVALNLIIFALIYGSLLSGIIYLSINNPKGLVFALQTYIGIVIVRIAMMYVVPLEPPIGTIDLQDPLVFVVGTGTKITKDLFFSGHTSTLFMIFLVMEKKWMKNVYLVNTILVGIFVILQKVHYSVDVMVAPFISYGVYRIVGFLNKDEKENKTNKRLAH
jgi:hypothetical protein